MFKKGKNFIAPMIITLLIIPQNLCSTTIAIAAPSSTTITALNSSFYDPFESSSLSKAWGQEFRNSNGTISMASVASGNSVFRAELSSTDQNTNGSKRTEIALKPEKPLEEHWYGVSIYLPSSSTEDYVDDTSPESIVQWHNVPDTHLGETWTSPPLSLQTLNGHYYIVRRWDDAAVSTNASMNRKGYYSETDLGSYNADKGKWVDWKFHVKWGWLASHDPKLTVYKNGVKVYDADGLPNTLNDQTGVYMKAGIYKWDWASNPSASTISKRVVYYDNISIDNITDIAETIPTTAPLTKSPATITPKAPTSPTPSSKWHKRGKKRPPRNML